MKKVLYMVIASTFLIQTSAHAAWMRGIIKDVDGKNVVIERSNANQQTAYEKELTIKILDNAKLKNIASLDELKAGQEVKLDARANKEQGQWDANYIELIDSDKKF